MLFRTRQMFYGPRTQMLNALRGHLAEHGLVAATGTAQLNRLADAIEDRATALPEGVRDLGQMYLAQIAELTARVAELDLKIRRRPKRPMWRGGSKPCRAWRGSDHGAWDRDICT